MSECKVEVEGGEAAGFGAVPVLYLSTLRTEGGQEMDAASWQVLEG